MSAVPDGALPIRQGDARHARDGARAPDDPAADRIEGPIEQAIDGAAGPRPSPAQDVDVVETIAALASAGAGLVALGAEGELDSTDVRAALAALAGSTGIGNDALELLLYSAAASSPRLTDLPPRVAIGIVLRLVHELDACRDISLWKRSLTGQPDVVVHIGPSEMDRRVRSEAAAALRGRERRLRSRTPLRSRQIRRFGQVVGALVGDSANVDPVRMQEFLDQAARALGPLLERELLLDRNRERALALATSAERRLTRLAFDLHDGPIQDVVALAMDVRALQEQLYPLIEQSHRELAHGRFDDLTARLSELDRTLREISHSLESRSIVSRPLGEIIHREVESFAERTGIETHLELRGDPDSLDSAQRITVYRAIQEGLANVREHAGASVVDVRVRARRNTIEVSVVDNGVGFEVSRALARAAKRGRLGLVGIGERVGMLGGSLEIDSKPGGPTALSFTLPR